MSRKPGASAPPDQAGRERILKELDRNLLVEAAAGTGKTTSMVGRMVELIAQGKCRQPGAMAAITFSRKAAAELRGRFQVALETAHRQAGGERQQRLAKALAGTEQCYIGTIHSFCARLLRERPVEAGVDVAFREVDDLEDARLREESWEDFCARLVADDPEELLEGLDRLGLALRDLRSAFLRFADYPDVDEWPAPTGQAKLPEFAPARKELVAYLDHMRALWPRLPEDPGNDTLIPEYRDLPRIAAHYQDLADPVQLAEMLERFGSAGIIQKEWTKTGHFAKEDAKGELARWERFVAEVAGPALSAWRACRYGPVIKVLRAAARAYARLRAERGVLNYQDLLMRAAALLRGAPHVRKYFRRRLTHLLVDEFQDTDPIQAEVMLLLTADDEKEQDWRRCRPRPGALFVVGDPKQSIYRFRRADIVTYNEVKRIITRESPAVTLSASFRTSAPLVAWVNTVFSSEGGFPREATEESPAHVALEPARVEGSAGELAGLKVLVIPEAEAGNQVRAAGHEAGVIARFIRDAIRNGRRIPRSGKEVQAGIAPGAAPDDFMIITRLKARLSIYARALQACGVPHQVTGGAALNELREIRLLHQAMTAALRPDDPVRLVGVLRGELFGISDRALYAFKKAGGRFNFSSALPQGLAAETAALYAEAFSKLKKVQRWLAQLPPAVAVEMAIAELGLMASASLSAGADVQAGALAKAVELLRGAQARTWSSTEVVRYLGELAAADRDSQKHDALSASPEEKPVVRVMNLHQAKGLEAPVVFLADPSGESDHPPDLRVDRSGSRILGHMAVFGERTSEWAPAPLLAHPRDWEALSGREQEFIKGENLRLKYVAATRAGAMLVVAKKDKGRRNSPWEFFAPHLAQAGELADPGAAPAPQEAGGEIRPADAAKALQAAASGLANLLKPTYEVHRAKDFALAGHKPGQDAETSWFPPEEDEHIDRDDAPVQASGAEWGVVIHLLLQAVANDPKADLKNLAQDTLPGHGLPVTLAGKAEAEVRGVMQSDLWKRAMAGGRRLAEAPFEMLDDDSGPVPVLLRGAIDLVFEEPDGWVLLDYKTDAPGAGGLDALVRLYAPQVELYARAWSACTGLQVKHKALYFTRMQRAVALRS